MKHRLANEDKVTILMRRLEGASVYEIEQQMDFSAQAISAYLRAVRKKLPDCVMSRVYFNPEEARMIFTEFVSGVAIGTIARRRKCTAGDIRGLLYDAARRRQRRPTTIYPELNRWLMDHRMTIIELCEALEIQDLPMFYRMLDGIRIITDEQAAGIESVTGIPTAYFISKRKGKPRSMKKRGNLNGPI